MFRDLGIFERVGNLDHLYKGVASRGIERGSTVQKQSLQQFYLIAREVMQLLPATSEQKGLQFQIGFTDH
jgi:hypothetical protein